MSDDELPRAVLRRAGLVDDADLAPRHGWSNQAWIGKHVVVRVTSGRLLGSMAHESVVCRTLAAAGFAVPEPRAHGLVRDVGPAVDPADVEAHRAEWLVSTRLPGETLADAWPDLPPEQRRRAGEDLGRFLRRLHLEADLDRSPAWWLDAHEPSGYHNAYRPRVGIAVAMATAANALPFADPELLDDVIAFLEERLPHFDGDRAVFCHTDVHGHNLLLDPTSGRLTGVLDWEGAHPAAPDVDLDMLLRWAQAAHTFPASPNGPTRLVEDDVLELVAHLAAAYPELFATPHLRDRLDVYEAQWQLVQLFFEDYWLKLGHGDPATPSASWAGLRRLLAGEHHLARFDL